MKYVPLTRIDPDSGDLDELYLLSSAPPTGIVAHDTLGTVLFFGSNSSYILVSQTPEEVMASFGAILDDRMVQ